MQPLEKRPRIAREDTDSLFQTSLLSKISDLIRMDYLKTSSASRLSALIELKNDLKISMSLSASMVTDMISHLRKFETVREREVVFAIIEKIACLLISRQRIVSFDYPA